jgi:uncharacterized protein
MGEIGMSPQQQQQQNKKLIQEGFDRWASNQGSFFDLLSNDIEERSYCQGNRLL